MDSFQGSTPVSERIKAQYAPANLTLTSIIQGAAITTLVARVEATSTAYTAANWLMVATTFMAFVLIWHEFLMQALAYVWLPSLVDSLVPFAFLAVELFVAHFVYGNQRGWLLAASVAFALGLVAARATQVQARVSSADNQGVLGAVRSIFLARQAFYTGLAGLSFAAWGLYDVLRLGQHPLAVALATLAGVVGALGTTVPDWNRVLAHARGERTRAASGHAASD
ncbi:MAG TPA: hypothetical protein VGR57_09365 [Ktedonobacterales bacterium]|nr:hypothetical protein [Ktedonobacterales bacterium]